MAKHKIGITGGIGSGKSYVCNLLASRGIPVYNCDTQAKHLMTENPALRNGITQIVGDKAYIHDKESGKWLLNKPVVAQYLFSDASHAAAIDALVHPTVKADFLQWVDNQDATLVAMESAILFESGLNTATDTTIEIYAPVTVRMQRAMQRDNATEKQISARMNRQMNEEEKRAKADHCIVNDGTLDLHTQIEQILKSITNKIKPIEHQ